jgi:hypothetical protein
MQPVRTSTQTKPERRQNSITMQPSKHKTTPILNFSPLLYTPAPLLPSPYLRHFTVLPCLQTTFYQKDERAPSANIYRNKSQSVTIMYVEHLTAFPCLFRLSFFVFKRLCYNNNNNNNNNKTQYLKQKRKAISINNISLHRNTILLRCTRCKPPLCTGILSGTLST